MKLKLIALLPVGLVACALPADRTCDEASFVSTCEGVTLSVCNEGFVSVRDCDAGTTCNAATGTCDVDVPPFCGDGSIDNGEECDNGDTNGAPGDSCNADCTNAECGDGITGNSPNEQCDDGNAVDDDFCKNDCTLNDNVTFCGDNVVQGATEECDNGANNGAPGNTCNADCTNAECGDGITGNTNGEDCDDGNNIDDDACDNNCQVNIPAGCGNGIEEAPEQCDDGNNVNNDGCDANCTDTACGNGIAAGAEQCDDGNTTSNDGCNNLCVLERCGDGTQQTSEECDDNNQINGDGCDAACRDEFCGDGFVNNVNEQCDDGGNTDDDGCDAACALEVCGDGVTQANEDCDDNNDINNDGCNNACTFPVCGNAIIDQGEQCDDGNTADGDGCDATCFFEGIVCGDGIAESPEQCDDGNNIDGDGCDATCVFEGAVCGDGVFEGPVIFSSVLPANLGVLYAEAKPGDLNGDGIQDMVFFSSLSVFTALGNGDGTFQPALDAFSAGAVTPFSMEIGDINNDGRDDVVITSVVIPRVTVLLSGGDGTLTQSATVNTLNAPRFFRLADVNRDNNLDAVLSIFENGNTSIFLGDGAGGLSTTSIDLGSGRRPHAVDVADFNNDGRPDIIEAHLEQASVGVFLQNLDGSFQSALISNSIDISDTIAVGDINGDGFIDAATTDNSGIALLLGRGDGTFASRLLPHVAGTGSIEVADLNRDGFDDIIASKVGENSLRLFFGGVNGASNPFIIPSGNITLSISVADFNNDGRLDLSNRTQNPFAEVRLALPALGEECDDGNTVDGDGCESDCTLACGNGTGAFGASLDAATGNCYLGFSNDRAWPDAQKDCERLGGYLAVPEDFAEQLRVRSVIDTTQPTWIGINDIAVEAGTNDFGFVKVTGGLISFAHFRAVAANEPSGSPGENCAALLETSPTSEWNDVDCSIPFDYVCEIEPIACGDGVAQDSLGEECDDGNSSDDDLCSSFCTTSRCGDNIEQEGELCFAPTNLFNTNGTEAFEVITADLNNDGILDLISPNFGSATVSTMLGRGDGTFGTPRLHATGTSPINVAAADISGDGVLDMAVTNFTSGTVSLFLGVGDGNFIPVPNALFAGPTPDGVELADLNGDGHLDLIVTTANDAISTVSISFGAPSAQSPINFPAFDVVITVGTQPRTVFARDIDGDGDLDLLTVNRTGNSISRLRNDNINSGTFTNLGDLSANGAGFDSTDIATGFFNNDSLLDIVVANSDTDRAQVFFGLGGGNFSAPLAIVTGDAPVRVAVADLNNDGFDDFALVTFFGKTLEIYQSLGNNTFAAPSTTATVTGETPNGIAAGDFNRDGRVDLAVAGNSPVNSVIQVHLGFGDGTATGNQTFPTGDSPRHVVLADFNGDGIDDAAVANLDSNNVSIMRGNSNGTFNAPVNFAVGVNPIFLVAADFNNDGDLDLATANFGGNSSSILTNDGAGVFTLAATLSVGTRPQDVDAGDIDNDGDVDLVFVKEGNNDATTFFNNSAGVFVAGDNFDAGTAPLGGLFADLNGDGDLDLVTTASIDARVRVFLGNGNGTFGAPQIFATGNFPRALTSADLDHDGDIDIITANENSDNITVLLNNGAGLLSSSNLVAGNSPVGVTATDLDTDGDIDLVALNRDSQDLSVFIGNGNGTFQPQVLIGGMGNAPGQLASSDINFDGTPDIVVAVAGIDLLRTLTSIFR